MTTLIGSAKMVRIHFGEDDRWHGKPLYQAIVEEARRQDLAGAYVVSVGYSIAGLSGAIAGWAAMCTPALLILPLMRVASRQATHRRMRSATHAVVAASAGLLIAAVAPLARDALTDGLTIGIAVACTVLMLRKVNPFWLVVGASVVALLAAVVSH